MADLNVNKVVKEENPFSFENYTTGEECTSQRNQDEYYSEESKKKTKKLLIIDDDHVEEENSMESEVFLFGHLVLWRVSLGHHPSGLIYQEPFIIKTTRLLVSWCSLDETTEGSEEFANVYVLPTTPDLREQHLLEQLQKLSKENTALTNYINKSKKEFLEYKQMANKRVGMLQKELEKTRNKEADETRALEDVVHVVEKNLQSTTKRALRAESQVIKLKEEVAHLKTKFQSQKQFTDEDYKRLESDYNQLVQTVEEKSKNAARLLRTAAEKTQPHVRQLQSGIQSLHFLANQFDDIGKVTEQNSTEEQNNFGRKT